MLLPYASDRPPRSAPYVTLALVLGNFTVFGAVMLVAALTGPDGPVLWFARFGLVPAAVSWHAPVTYAFLHDRAFHLSANMLFLWVFGGSVEDALGRARFLALYVLGSAATGLLECGMVRLTPGSDPNALIVGASGGVATVVGVFAVRHYRSRVRFVGLPVALPGVLVVGIVLALEIGGVVRNAAAGPGASAATAHWAHIGGFAIGLLWAQATRQISAARREYRRQDASRELAEGSAPAATLKWAAIVAGDPSDTEARSELAHALAVEGERERSLEEYLAALRGLGKSRDHGRLASTYRRMVADLQPAGVPAADRIQAARSLEEDEAWAEAILAYEHVLQEHADAPEAETALLRSADIRLRRTGEIDAAAQELATFLNRYPKSQWAAFAEQRLREARRGAGPAA